MKRLLSVTFLISIAILAIGCNGKRVAVVNANLVYEKSVAGERGTEHIRNVTTELEGELQAIQQRAQDAKDKQAAQAELQQALNNVQQRFNAEQQNVVNTMSEMFKQAMDNCRAKYNLDVILHSDQPLSYDPAIDITDKVLEEMNAMPVDFRSLDSASDVSAPQ